MSACFKHNSYRVASSGFPTNYDTNRAVQPHKMVRGLKHCMYKVERFYVLFSENKAGYRAADLRLCFRICKKWAFS